MLLLSFNLQLLDAYLVILAGADKSILCINHVNILSGSASVRLVVSQKYDFSCVFVPNVSLGRTKKALSMPTTEMQVCHYFVCSA